MAKARTIGFRKIRVTVAVAGTAVPISENPLFVSDFEIFPLAANTGANSYVGNSEVDNTWIPRPKGEAVNFVHGTGNFIGRDAVVGIDLSRIYVDSDSNGDVVIVQYFAGDR